MKQERDLDWTFIPGSSANYLSHELVEANANCLVFRPSGRFVAFCRTLFYGPLLLILFFIWSPLEHAMHIILCLVASTVGGFIEWVSKVLHGIVATTSAAARYDAALVSGAILR
ncbi:MAG TPA: hypothetical protein VE954_29305 [Oligoflexus sp.]|uniref:hypothetical protein n=1 Tax=Oligoflexus sp. TaxID=1971216 RepID=UPI002D266F3D|nr:hypothetical protein [Oligoflexus sp.]HYX37221.1 hypothetical protein [Oligoflexus sp.]